MRKIVLGLVLAVSLAMPDRAAAAEKYLIDNQVWGWYQQYLRNIGNGNKPGAFVITKDGHGAFYSWCPDIRCVAGPTYSQDALTACEREYDTDCVVFAVRDDIKVEYEIAAKAPSTTQPTAVTPPASGVATVRISSAVREDVERYLRNSESSSANYRFLAINQAGDEIGTSNCKKMTTWISDGCAGMSNPYEGAKRVALQACGGPGECRLIFEGGTKIGVFEIEWY